MPQIKSSEYSLMAAKEDLDIAKGALYPYLGISANSFSRYSDQAMDFRPGADDSYTFTEQLDDNFIPYIGIFDLLYNEGLENSLKIIRKGRKYENR